MDCVFLFGGIMTVYLLHFDVPYRHAQHYLGYASNLDRRLAEHRAGHGARLMEVVNAAGINWALVRTWDGDRKLERRLKNRHKASGICPICRALRLSLDNVPLVPFSEDLVDQDGDDTNAI